MSVKPIETVQKRGRPPRRIMPIRFIGRMVVLTASAALILGGCSNDPSVDDVTAEVEAATEAAGEAAGAQLPSDDSADKELPDGFPAEFPLPDDYTINVSSGNAMGWFVMLKVEPDWEEMKDFYTQALAAAGWDVTGDRPFVAKKGTEIDANKGNREVTVGVTTIDGETTVNINLVKS